MCSGKTIRQLMLAAAMLLCYQPRDLAGAECASQTYRDAAFTEAATQFTPYERVFIGTKCGNLSIGEHTVRVNWIHQRQGLFRSDKHNFRMEVDGQRVVYFWFKLTKKGPLSSAFSTSDFHKENYGKWTAEIYLDDRLVSQREFEIMEGTD